MGDNSSPRLPIASVGDRIIVIGTGCTGLSIAQGLQKAGISVIVFEKNEALSAPGQRDWNMGLHWGAPILQELIPPAFADLLQSCQVDPNRPTKDIDNLKFINGSDGTLMSSPEIPNFHRLRRSKLRALLAQGLDIRYNKKLKNIVFEHDGTTATAVFEDGEYWSGRLIIGADGARSSVRRLLLGPDLSISTRLPYSATFIQAKYTREQALFLRSFHPLFLAGVHPSGLFAFFGVQDASEIDKPEEWTFFFYISWKTTFEQQDKEGETYGNKERLAQVKEKSLTWCEPWKSAFAWLPDDQLAWHFHISVWDPSLPEHEWDNKNGRVTLAGDAAHPMTFQRGQGLNHSIADAGKLVRLLTPEYLKQSEAIAKYEHEMKERAGEEVKLSVLNTTMLHDWDKVMVSPVMQRGLNSNK